LPGNNKFPNENVGFSQGTTCSQGIARVSQGKKSSLRKMHLFLREEQVPSGIALVSQGITSSQGNCTCFPRNAFIFLGELVAPQGKWAFSVKNGIISLGNWLFLGANDHFPNEHMHFLEEQLVSRKTCMGVCYNYIFK
jgi:hypothetical protein